MVGRITLHTFLAVAAFACGGSTFDATGTTGTAAGDSGATGGAVGTGGAGGAGGAIGTGGVSATGGAAGSGGIAQTGGAPGTGGVAGAPGGAAECATADDCTLFTDCCTCAPVKKGTTLASCNMACVQSDCAARGIQTSDVACASGRCVFNRTCDPAGVLCKVLAPTCPTGQAPLIVGNCYAGGCAPVQYCSEVATCDVCTGAGLPCVIFQLLLPPGSGSGLHCVTTPDRCAKSPTCACMGVCAPYQCMQPDSTDLLCQCPTC